HDGGDTPSCPSAPTPSTRLSCSCCFFLFFFQAEDGIRDPLVTGVQTCALPISQQRRGRHVQKAELGAQWELGPDVFARVRWNAGTVLDRWSFDPASYVDGMGVELGAKTFAGRLSLSASGKAHTSWPMIEIAPGDPF